MHVEIWSDIACPWCYVGKRRFEAALALFPHRERVTVTWRSFELDPGAPSAHEGDGATRLARKYGMTREKAVEMQEHMTTIAAADGLEFRFDIQRGGSTFDAHRLVHLAHATGGPALQDAVKERLLRAYMTEGELMADHAMLARIAAEAGIDPDEIRDTLATDRFATEVREDERTAAGLGIHAVPFFVIDRSFGAAGAQTPEVLLGLLERAWRERPALAVVADGDTCGHDGC